MSEPYDSFEADCWGTNAHPADQLLQNKIRIINRQTKFRGRGRLLGKRL